MTTAPEQRQRDTVPIVPTIVNISDGHSKGVRLLSHEWDLLSTTCELPETATVSSCLACRAAVLATRVVQQRVAPMRGVIEGASEIEALCEDAPMLHLYVSEESRRCRHGEWRDPGHTEWSEVLSHALLRPR